MRTKLVMIAISLIIAIVIISNSKAKEVTLAPKKVSVITSPTNNRDTRILVYFNLPEGLLNAKSIIGLDYALLIVKAQVTDAVMGEIDILPITTDWKSKDLITWQSPWTSPGGDYSIEHSMSNMTLKSEWGEKEITFDVTGIVIRWLEGGLDNNGLIIMPLKEELEISSVKFNIDQDSLKIHLKYNEFE